MIRIAGLMELIWVLAVSAPAVALQETPHVHTGPHNEAFNVGKNGDVKINLDVMIGDALVKKGKYLLAHRAEADHHIVVLTRIDARDSSEVLVHEIRTRFVPSVDSVKRSALLAYPVSDGSYRVPIIRIMEESGDHIPDSVSAKESR